MIAFRQHSYSSTLGAYNVSFRQAIVCQSFLSKTRASLRPQCTSRRHQSHLHTGNHQTGLGNLLRFFTVPRQWPTIYALSTAAGRAAIAIIRVSGPACKEIFDALCPNTLFPKPRYASLRSIHGPPDSFSKRPLLDPGALVIYFPSPKTVTGEDVLEFHVHGGTAIVKAVLSAVGQCSSSSKPVLYAEPGEFTRRAFWNDRLDLTQVEALADTLSAVTEEQRRMSVEGTVSGLAQRYESWRQKLLAARGELEALIDFSEDQHFERSPANLAASVAVQVESLRKMIYYHCSNSIRGELLRNGIAVSLIGAPNVGKSSLLNQIVGRNAAIVSKEAGTTRDVVEVGVDLGGFFCRFSDTAGLRRAGLLCSDGEEISGVGEIEQEGIRRAKDGALKSDLVLLMLSIEPAIDGQGWQLQLEQDVLETASHLANQEKSMIVAINKIDLYDELRFEVKEKLLDSVIALLPAVQAKDVFWISCKIAEKRLDAQEDGQVRLLIDGLLNKFKELTSPLSFAGCEADPSMWRESLGATERQRTLLQTCMDHLDGFLELVLMDGTNSEKHSEVDIDIVAAAESLRAAADCLARITGRGEAGDVEEVLGVVFEKFCVGK